MPHAIESMRKILGGLAALAALGGWIGAQHARPHGRIHSLEGDVHGEPREVVVRSTGVRADTLEEGLVLELLELEPELGAAPVPRRRILRLSGGQPGSPAALQLERRVLYAGELVPAGGIVVRGSFGRCGTFEAELPDGLELAGLAARGAALATREVSVSLALDPAQVLPELRAGHVRRY